MDFLNTVQLPEILATAMFTASGFLILIAWLGKREVTIKEIRVGRLSFANRVLSGTIGICLFVFSIWGSVPKTQSDKAFQSPVLENIADISGNWQVQFTILGLIHTGEIYLKQEQFEISGSMNISYSHRDSIVVVKEKFVGKIDGDEIFLDGTSFKFINQGAAISYSLDSFRLKLNSAKDKMEGDAFDRNNEKGKAAFTKQKFFP